jgi:YD repeat-containing protein
VPEWHRSDYRLQSISNAGNLIDDQANYTYKYDAFGRLTEVRSRTTTALVAEYRSNGLGFRTGWHYDATKDGTVNASDPWYWFCNDARWRPIATFRDSDADPKERMIFHARGLSVIDSLDCSTAWRHC